MFSYSAQDKLVIHKQQINNLPEQLITKNTYDELGQLISKNVGGTDITGTNGLQKVDYAYNIRGWLKAINDVNTIGTDLFAFKINYNDAETATPLFNGNISETFWKTKSDNVKRKYDYKYDDLNRLLRADYSKEGSTAFNSYLEKIDYDKNGNIQTLQRNGEMDTDGYQFENPMDDLTYLYDDFNKNQLLRVFDATANESGFKDDTDGTDINIDKDEDPDYVYDANGNMIRDNNKGIEEIKYNHLNLPVEISFSNGKINYLYNALGQKVKKTVTEGNVITNTDYLSGFQYKNTVLQFFPHAEGYVNATQEMVFMGGTSYKFHYVFNYTDHLGNIRLSYSNDPVTNVLKIIEENHYYPFGLKHSGYNSDRMMLKKVGSVFKIMPTPPLFVTSYDYRYNGKEYQDELGLNQYDYGARNYDPALGRWMNIDPLAEQMRRYSPYNYAFDNPVYFIDPDGMKPLDWVSINGQVVNDSRVTDQKTATEHYGDKAVYRPSGYEYTAKSGENVVLGDNGEFKVNGESSVSPDLAPGTLSEVNSASNQAITYATEGTTAFVASQFKSNNNPFSFNQLKDNQTAWRTKAVLGKTGANALGLVKGLGNVTAIATPAFHGYEIYNRPDGSTTTMEQVDLGVEIFGAGTVIGTMFGYISNPVGWSIGAASTAYSAFRYGQSNDVMEEIRSEPGLNGCFAKGTLITMSDGSEKEIQDVKVGDLVLTYNFKTSQLEPKKVLQKINPIRNEIITIEFDNGVKNTNTTDHPYFAENKKWSSFSPELTFKNYNFTVNQIEKGDSCFYISKGKLVKVKIVSFEVTNSSTQTYNLSDVEDNNNFFANGILVHNKN